MSAVYRINVEHRPGDVCEWYAIAYRLSDDRYMSGSGNYADSSVEAVEKVRVWIAAESSREDGFSVYADEEGNVLDLWAGWRKS